MAEGGKSVGPSAAELRETLLIVDTDVGGDPDDAVALVVAARRPELALVLTSDEHGDRRARLARHLLDLLGRSDVPVVAGRDLGNEKYWAADGLVPEDVVLPGGDVVGAVRWVLTRAEGWVRWLGLGPMSNLADVVREIPDCAGRLVVTQMGGDLDGVGRAEHNIRLDVDAAQTVLRAGLHLRIVPADVTFHPENEINSSSREYTILEGSRAAGQLLRAHLDRWFESFYPGTMQHDAMALGRALEISQLRSETVGVDIDETGKLTYGQYQVSLTRSADYPAFRSWLLAWLDDTLAAEKPFHPISLRQSPSYFRFRNGTIRMEERWQGDEIGRKLNIHLGTFEPATHDDITEVLRPAADLDYAQLFEERFVRETEEARRWYLRGDGPIFEIYRQIEQIFAPIRRRRRSMTDEEIATITALWRKTFALWEEEFARRALGLPPSFRYSGDGSYGKEDTTR
ncbi:nucleoside hydrolase [Nocardia sp. NPDC059240]|uniref:nucleoside hydrolase n=1 Tax=Nocardia sp. NPDC059240 TaxID=3346786 RepID=UPI0036A5E756